MKPHQLFTAVCAACLVLPALALADPPADRGNGKDKKDEAQAQSHPKGQDRAHGGGKKADAAPTPNAQRGPEPAQPAKTPQAPQAQRAPDSRATPPSQQVQRAPEVQRAPQAPRAPEAQRAPAAPAAPAQAISGQPDRNRGADRSGQARPGQPQASQQQPQAGQPDRNAQSRPQGQRGPVATPPPAPPLRAWSAPPRGPQRDQAANQWRQQTQNWDRNTVWRQQSDWWRGDVWFSLFTGPRIGYYFVPERGYVQVPRQYRSRHWREGDYLPSWFRAYSVSDYRRLGLPRPPRGCTWVWLNNDVALIDRSDGYILDIARNVW